MKKNELMNGDIVVLTGGVVAVVIGEGKDAYLLWQHGGFETLDECYDDDLYNEMDDSMVMQVFRSNGYFGLEGVDQEVPIWERDETWVCPSEKEREESHRLDMEYRKAEFQASLECMAETRAEREDVICIVAQQFYGNRTGTEIKRDDVEEFLCCHLDDDPPADIRTVPVPGADGIVIVYEQTQEDRYVNVDFPQRYAEYADVYREGTGREFTMHVSCEIPEIDFKIHTRCFACRMDENGVLQSLRGGDGEKYIHYFPER